MSQNRRPKLESVISPENYKKVREVFDPMELTDEIVKRIMSTFEDHIHRANSPDESTRKTSDLQMENTHIRCLLDGTESGEFLGLDLGGTNFRILQVTFTQGKADTTVQYYTLTEDTLAGPTAGVFDFIAACLKDFFEKNNLMTAKKKMPLGFCFSFPSRQKTLNSSVLVTWTKSFCCPDGPGLDPVQLLNEAIERTAPGLPLDIVVVASDTTTTLLAGNYVDKNCRIGLILGTGSNAAFVEHVENVDKWTGDMNEPREVLVNVEWGAFGDSGCMDFCKSEFEKETDAHSNHPNSFTLEKSIAGLYLGELVRLLLMKLVAKGALFQGQASDELATRWSLESAHVTAIEGDEGSSTQNTREFLEEFGLADRATEEDIAIVREACEFLSRRGGTIVCALLAVLVRHINRPKVTISIDGSLYEKHPRLHGYMMETLRKLCPKCEVSLILTKDGSGQGGAFAAAMALRQTQLKLRCS